MSIGQLKVGDRFWLDAKTCGLGKPYWFKVVKASDTGYALKTDGEYIEPPHFELTDYEECLSCQ